MRLAFINAAKKSAEAMAAANTLRPIRRLVPPAKQFPQTPLVSLRALPEELVNGVAAVRLPHPKNPLAIKINQGLHCAQILLSPDNKLSASRCRSLLRNGERSMELNSCFNSPTFPSKTEHLGEGDRRRKPYGRFRMRKLLDSLASMVCLAPCAYKADVLMTVISGTA